MPRSERQEWLAEMVAAPRIDECIYWPFYLSPNSRPLVWIPALGRMAPASWRVLELDGRPRPLRKPQIWALHSCDHGTCLNPAHLRWGSPAENFRDMIERRRLGDQ